MPARKSVGASTLVRLSTTQNRRSSQGQQFQSDTAVLQGRADKVDRDDSKEKPATDPGINKFKKKATAIAKLSCLSSTPSSDNGVSAAARRSLFSQARNSIVKMQLESAVDGFEKKMIAAKAVMDGSRNITRQKRCIQWLSENVEEQRARRLAEEAEEENEEDSRPIQDYSDLLHEACEYAARLNELSRTYAELGTTKVVTNTIGKIDHCMDLLKSLKESGAACIESLTQAREIADSGQLSQSLLTSLADDIAAMRAALSQQNTRAVTHITLDRRCVPKMLDVLQQLEEKCDSMDSSCGGYFDRAHAKAIAQGLPESTLEDQNDLAARRVQAIWRRKRITVSQVVTCEKPPTMPEKEPEEEKEETEEEAEKEQPDEQIEEGKQTQTSEEQQPTQQAPQAQEQVPLEKDDKEDEEKDQVPTSSSNPPAPAPAPASAPAPAPAPGRPATVDSAPSKPSRSIARGARPPALDLQGSACRLRANMYATTPADISQPRPPEGLARSESPKTRLPLLRAPPKTSEDDNRICKNMDDLKAEELALLRSIIDEEIEQAPGPSPRPSIHSVAPPASRSPRNSLLRRLSGGSSSPPRDASSRSSISVTHDPAKERLWREVFDLEKSPATRAAKSAWAEVEPGELSQVSTASPRSLEPLGDDSPRITLTGLVAGGYPFRRRGTQPLEPLQLGRPARLSLGASFG